MKMIVCDLSAIEHRVVGWVSRCKKILDVHRAKRDPYLDFSIILYPDRHYNYDDLYARYLAGDPEIKKIRQDSKAPVLGGGFGLGGGELIVNEFGDEVRSGLWGYALNVCGTDLSKELSHQAVRAFRKEYSEVPVFWTDMEEGFKEVLKNGKTITIGKVTWDKWNKEWLPVAQNAEGAYITFSRVQSKNIGNIIRMKLPSGRYLHYLNARIVEEEFTWTDKRTGKKMVGTGEVIYYDGIEHSATTDDDGSVSKKAHKWGKTKSYGGKLTENCVQAIARDILVNGARLATDTGFQIWGLFHDEIATLVPDSWNAPTLEDLRYCMSEPPEWGKTLLLDAAGYTGKFYKKG